MVAACTSTSGLACSSSSLTSVVGRGERPGRVGGEDGNCDDGEDCPRGGEAEARPDIDGATDIDLDLDLVLGLDSDVGPDEWSDCLVGFDCSTGCRRSQVAFAWRRKTADNSSLRRLFGSPSLKRLFEKKVWSGGGTW